jgi:hypothetical protein
MSPPTCQTADSQLKTCLGDLQQTKQNTFLLETHLAKKKKKRKKKQNSKTLNPQPVKSFSKPHYTEKAVGLHYCQTLASNLPRKYRQTGLDAKGETPELLSLKFYCS